MIKHYLVVLSLLSSLPASCCSNSPGREVQCVHSLLSQHSHNTHTTHSPSFCCGGSSQLWTTPSLPGCDHVPHTVIVGLLLLLIAFPCAQSLHADTHMGVHCYSTHITPKMYNLPSLHPAGLTLFSPCLTAPCGCFSQVPLLLRVSPYTSQHSPVTLRI